jgi:uncharacterized protein DUF29
MVSAVSETVNTMPDGPRYEDDFFAWTQHQAMVLRSMTVADNRFDRQNVAEEIEDLGRSQRDAVRSQIRRIIVHFLKLAHSRSEQPRFGWMETIDDAREALSDKLTATLHRDAEASLEGLYADGQRRAGRELTRHGELEAARQLPSVCPYSIDDILREDWYPEPPGETP